MNILNATPHAIVFRGPEGDVTFPPSGQVARVETVETDLGNIIDGMPVIRRGLGKVTIPESPLVSGFDDGEMIRGFVIVSSMVLEAAKGTDRAADLIAPDTGPTAIRDKGQVVAVTRWVMI